MIIGRELLRGTLKYSEQLVKALYFCTLCGYCRSRCSLETTKVLRAMRADAVKTGILLKGHEEIRSHMMNGNPYGEPRSKRPKWFDMNLKSLRPSDTLFFPGCTAAYKRPTIAKAAATILKKAGMNFTVADNEMCCGTPLIATGQADLAHGFAMANSKLFKHQGIKRIITPCAECYKAFKYDYPEILGVFDLEVSHMSEVIEELTKKGRIRFIEGETGRFTYHDPCLLGREGGNLYELPRRIINKVPGITLVEMARNRHRAYCCGAGGGFKEAFAEEALLIAKERLEEAKETGANAIITTCPRSVVHFQDAIDRFGIDFKVYDLMEVVSKALDVKGQHSRKI